MKLCPQCERENPSSANYCMYCRSTLTLDEQVDEIDKLHQELNEANATIQLLKKALATAQEQAEKQPEKTDAIIQSLQAELTDMKQKCSEYEKTIAAQKNTTATSSQELTAGSKSKKGRNGYWIFFLLLSIIALVIVYGYYSNELDSKKQDIDWAYQIQSSLGKENEELKSENKKLKSEIEKLKSENEILDKISDYPMIIKSLKVGNMDKDNNVETEAGKTLYSATSMYLYPEIEYVGLRKRNTTITLYLKLFQNGILSYNSSISPSGYSYSRDFYISDSGKTKFGGWGSDVKGTWPSGSYRYEIWYNKMCLKAVNFKLF
jgi:cell division protein FtsB